MGCFKFLIFNLGFKVLPFFFIFFFYKWQSPLSPRYSSLFHSSDLLFFHISHLKAVVSNNAEEGDDCVQDGQDAQHGLHVSTTLLQNKVDSDRLHHLFLHVYSVSCPWIPLLAALCLAVGDRYFFFLIRRWWCWNLGKRVWGCNRISLKRNNNNNNNNAHLTKGTLFICK